VSLKDDIAGVKKELSTEESFLEGFLKVEKFYKKNKTAIIGGITAVVIGVIGFYTYSYLALQEKIKVNIAFNKVLENPEDKKALEDLKTKSGKLYKVALFIQDNNSKSDIEFLNQLSLYSDAIAKNDAAQIASITQNQNFLLKDFALLNKAIIEAKNGEYAKAKESLKTIPEDSDTKALVQILQHYLMTK
jgi:hypothetical protein